MQSYIMRWNVQGHARREKNVGQIMIKRQTYIENSVGRNTIDYERAHRADSTSLSSDQHELIAAVMPKTAKTWSHWRARRSFRIWIN